MSVSEPRSRRVGFLRPGDLLLPPLPDDDHSVLTSSPSELSLASTLPPIPPRSPRRPSGTKTVPVTSSTIPVPPTPPLDILDMPLLRSRSFGSLAGMLDSSPAARPRPKTPEKSATLDRPMFDNKPLPITPDPSTSTCVDPREDDDADEELDTDLHSETASSLGPGPKAVTKRTHALLELLSSERAYASDLALIRDVYIPLALGQPAPFEKASVAESSSSGSSSRSSSSSDPGGPSSTSPPMTREDVQIIFNNISEIAVFSDTFTERLEEFMGGAVEGGSGDDRVGALFLETIPTLEQLYKTYITKHSSALEHLGALPQTPALSAYLTQSRALATSFSHAWDLPSLLIKPVQRLLKYALLLAAIIDETPDVHPDKENLRLAREKMEEVARGVNEGRRRREVIKEVLTSGVSGSPVKKGTLEKPKKKGLNLNIAASVSLGRMKSLRSNSFKAKEGIEANHEAEQVKALGEELKRCETFLNAFAKNSVDWCAAVRQQMQTLIRWGESFGRMIWMGEPFDSQAFDAFLTVVRAHILPVCDDVAALVRTRLLPQLSALRDTLTAPMRLLEAMHTLEPLHYGLLNLNVAKSRPPPQLLEASQSYVALRAQLFAELPQYLKLMDKGCSATVRAFAEWQATFYSDVRDRWNELWEALKVEGDASQLDTEEVWQMRWAPVEHAFAGLHIVRPPRRHPRPVRKQKSRGRSPEEWSETSSTVVVHPSLTPLDPLAVPDDRDSATYVASPTSAKSRSLHSIDSGRRPLERRSSNESLPVPSRRPSRHASGLKAKSQDMNYEHGMAALPPGAQKPHYTRTKSMPISGPMPLGRAGSQGRALEQPGSVSASASSSVHSLAHAPDADERGRPTRKPSFRRRLTDSIRPSPPTSIGSKRRSPSLPPMSASLGASPVPSPKAPSFATNTGRHGGAPKIPALYTCRVVHPCEPPAGVAYHELPFFKLRVDDEYDVLHEAGHPSTHPDLPLYVDEGEDCLLLVRRHSGEFGWALASFLVPVD